MKYKYYVEFECDHEDTKETMLLLNDLIKKQLTDLGATLKKPHLVIDAR